MRDGASAANGQTTSLEQLGQAVLSLLDELRIDQLHFCGIAMGGLTGLWLVRFYPQRLLTLTVDKNSATKIGDPAAWKQ